MAGFDNDVVYGQNVDFRNVEPIVGQMTANGQLLIGAAVSPFIRANVPTSSNGSITITTGAGTLDFIANSAAVGQTITGDDLVALSPTLGNWNIVGRSGSKTSGTGSTLTINSPPFANQGVGTTVTLNSGSFATAAITLTTPASAGLLDGDLLQFVATNGVLVIQLAATQVAHIGTLVTTTAGTMTSTSIGDSLTLRYQLSANAWWATSVIGTWVMA